MGVTGGIEKLAVTSVALLTAAFGSWLFGELADRFGRKSVYGWEMLVLAAGAIASAFSPSVWWLVGFRAILGFGIGGDYPVSSTLMSEYAGRRDRGKLVALVFSAQGLGLVIGPLLAVILLGAGVAPDPTWRILLGAGALPALAVSTCADRSPRRLGFVWRKSRTRTARIAAPSAGACSATAGW